MDVDWGIGSAVCSPPSSHLLHGFVKQVTPEDDHVFVREKDAIVGYRKQGAGVMSCIMGDDNQPWVRSIGKRLAVRVAQC